MLNNLKNIFNSKLYSQEEKVRDSVLVFLLIIWFIDPSNKLILLFFLIFLSVLAYLTKKLDISLVLTFFLSSFFSVGKTYFIQLLDLKKFPNLIPFYPIGLVSRVQITVSDVLFTFLVIYFIIISYKKLIQFKKITLIDIFLVIFLFYGIFSDLIGSNNLLLSLFLKKDLFEYIFMYFFIKFGVKNHGYLFKLLLNILISLVLFEFFVVLQQFIYSSPIGKSLESIHDIEFFGQGSDELYFVFRPIGTFFHANALAMFLSAVLPFFLFYMIRSKQYLFKLVFILTIICLILTLSRAAWLASLISVLLILFYFEYYKKIKLIQTLNLKKILFYLILALPLLFYSIPRFNGIFSIFQEGSGLDLRIRQTSEVVGMISQSPLFGVGTGMSVIRAIEKNPVGVFASFPSEIHNYYLLLVVENGIPYLIFFIFFLVLSFKKLINYRKDLAFISAVSYLSIIVVAFFQPFLAGQLLFIFPALNFDTI